MEKRNMGEDREKRKIGEIELFHYYIDIRYNLVMQHLIQYLHARCSQLAVTNFSLSHAMKVTCLQQNPHLKLCVLVLSDALDDVWHATLWRCSVAS